MTTPKSGSTEGNARLASLMSASRAHRRDDHLDGQAFLNEYRGI
jgi:hypothetical protein